MFSERLLGLYVYGSLVWGDFDERLSDIDILAVLSTEVKENDLQKLTELHAEVTVCYPEWDDRIEVQYACKEGLQTFREHESTMANISPGEPLHIVRAGREWLLNWYFVQEYGYVLYGAPPGSILPYICREEFFDAVKAHALEWRSYIEKTRNSRSYQAYAVLTLCRALCVLSTGRQVSKLQAADWMIRQYPEFGRTVRDALVWREHAEEPVDPALTFDQAKAFVLAVSSITEGCREMG